MKADWVSHPFSLIPLAHFTLSSFLTSLPAIGHTGQKEAAFTSVVLCRYFQPVALSAVPTCELSLSLLCMNTFSKVLRFYFGGSLKLHINLYSCLWQSCGSTLRQTMWTFPSLGTDCLYCPPTFTKIKRSEYIYSHPFYSKRQTVELRNTVETMWHSEPLLKILQLVNNWSEGLNSRPFS